MRSFLISPVSAVLRRLDPAATRASTAAGGTGGYDDVLGEPVIYDDPLTGARKTTKQYLPDVKVPCQVEMLTFERLRMHFAGNAPDSNIMLVFHRRDLEDLGLIDQATSRPLLNPIDEIVHFEKKDSTDIVMTFKKQLYIFEVRPGSWGFGPDGHDLELCFTTVISSNVSRQR